MRPISAPWLLRFRPRELEVRLLAEGDPASGVELEWQGPHDSRPAIARPAGWRPTRLGPAVHVLRFAIAGYAGAGLRYRLHCGGRRSLVMRVAPDPGPGETWRFLVASDHQNLRGVRRCAAAVDRLARTAAFHGVLFAGDLANVPDERTVWCGGAEGTAFLDTMAAPVQAVFPDGLQTPRAGAREAAAPGGPASGAPKAPRGWPVLSTAPIFACAGNHEVSSAEPRGASPAERFDAVTPDRWDIATFAALMLPAEADAGAAPLGCYAAEIGPLSVLALFVANRWMPGDHERRTGPCYEPPGRFIFESIEPGSRQLAWLAAQVAAAGAVGPRAPQGPAPMLRVALLHHPPYAQGFNTWPLFGHPPEYEANLIDRHVVPLLERWARLVLSGHNHAVNHHVVRGVHYHESSHMGAGKEACAHDPDGRPAREPMGHPGEFFAGHPEASYFSVLRVVAGPARVRASLEVHRALAGGATEVVREFDL